MIIRRRPVLPDGPETSADSVAVPSGRVVGSGDGREQPRGWRRHPHVSVALAGLVALTFGTGAVAAVSGVVPSGGSTSGTERTTAATPPHGFGSVVLPHPGRVPHAPATRAPQAPPTRASRTVHVPRPHHLVAPTILLQGSHPLTRNQTHKLRSLSGVTRTETVDAGRARVDGHRASLVGIGPASFRRWTPQRTAHSNRLWSSIASGELTASFDMGRGAKLPLGSDVPVRRNGRHVSLRVGAFASVGLGGVDAVVTHAVGRHLGLVPHSGVLLSAPSADPLVLQREAEHILGRHVHSELLRQVALTRDAGEFIGNSAIESYLRAAAGRLGKPYVWGATGPKSFDCSGLVQWSFAKAGIQMPRVAADQFLTGAHVRYADARPGDLLFWHYDPTDPTDVDHVAIYAGDGKMIVAPHTGLDVQYVPVPLPHLAGVVRVDPALAAQVG